MDIDTLSLSEIWKLTTTSALELHNLLDLTVPENYTLYDLRDNLAHLKRDRLSRPEYVNDNFPDDRRSPVYEDIDDFSTSSSSDSQEPFRGFPSFQHLEEKEIPMMAVPQERLPFFHPGTFSGLAGEMVEGFLVRFERAAVVNGWGEEKKKVYFPMYLADTAAVVFDNLERKNQRLTWEEIKQEFSKTFSPVESRELLLAKLNSRVQLPTESIVQYIADVEKLCALTDAGMEERRICNHVLKGLNPGTLQQISMWDNSTLAKLRDNIAKYEMSSFMVRQRLGLEAPQVQEAGQQFVLTQGREKDTEMMRRLESMEQAMERLHISMVRAAEGTGRRPRERIEEDWNRNRTTTPRPAYGQQRWRPTTYEDDTYQRRGAEGMQRDGNRWREQDWNRSREWNPGPRSNFRGQGQPRWDRSVSRERSLSRDRTSRTTSRDKGCFRCGSMEHFARGCRANFSKN